MRMPNVAAVVLAAGRSTRMGTHKLLLPLEGEPLVRRTVQQVCKAGFDDVLVVVGYEHDKVLAALDGLPIRHAVNPEYATGMGSSFRTAIEHVSADEYRWLLQAYWEGDPAERPAIVTARYKNLVTGPPHLFTRALFPELAVLEHGARPVLERYFGTGKMRIVKLLNHSIIDIDTPDDYERVKNILEKR